MSLHKTLITALILLTSQVCLQAQEPVSGTPEEANPIQLQLNLPQTNQYRLFSTEQQTVKQRVLDKQATSTLDQSFQVRIENLSTENQSYQFRLHFERITVLLQTPTETLNLDTDLPESNPGEALHYLKSLLQEPVTIYLSKFGELRTDSNQSPGSINTEQIVESLSLDSGFQFPQYINTQTLVQEVAQCFDFYPKETIEIGQSWVVNSPSSKSKTGKSSFKKEYTLEGLSEDLAWLNSSSMNEAGEEEAGMEVQQKSQDTIEVDLATGMLQFREKTFSSQGTKNTTGLPISLEFNSSKTITIEQL